MTDTEVKALVRKRDGYICRDCGLTDEQSLEAFGTALHVHRLYPGSVYRVETCVTLCQACHGKKPKHADALVFSPPEKTGLFLVSLNLYDPEDSRIHSLLVSESEKRGVDILDLIDSIFKRWADGLPSDYCI